MSTSSRRKAPIAAVKSTPADRRLDEMRQRAEAAERGHHSASERADGYRAERDEAIRIATERKQRIGNLEAEVSKMRDELHGLTVEKSRLEGYIDRAREFDPPAETKMVTVPEEMVRAPRLNGGGDEIDRYGSIASGMTPWYKRNI